MTRRPLIVLFLGGLLATSGVAQPPAPRGHAAISQSPHPESTLPTSLPALAGVKEPFFALVLGVVRGDYYGMIPVQRLQLEMARQPNRTRIPLNPLVQITRAPHAGRPFAQLEVVSARAIRLPLPYDVLGYHPGTLRGSRALSFLEWDFGDVTFTVPGESKGDPPRTMVMEDVRAFGLAEGFFEVDVDGWVDKLMGGKIDDTRMVGLASFTHAGKQYGLSMGYNPKGQGRTGLFDFAKDEIVFPLPREYKFAGILLRGRLERLMPGLAERGKAFGKGSRPD